MAERKSRVRPEFAEAVKNSMGTLSQSEVALRSEISVGYVNRMVRGVVPSQEIVMRLAEGLGVDSSPMLLAAGYTLPKTGDVPPAETESATDELLGSLAAAQYYRDLWDRYVEKLFPGAEMPSGAGMPLTRSGIRYRVTRLLTEMIDATETE